MSNFTLSSEINGTNETCLTDLHWTQEMIDYQRPLLYICIVATITHSIFWFQFMLYPSVRQRSMQWLYAYLVTDILLLMRFFVGFIVHTMSTDCTPTKSWSLFICYFEATFDNYLNMLEVYILLALNICRYVQIVHNRSVYISHVKLLVCSHLIIYIFPLAAFIIQLQINWARLRQNIGASCDIDFTNIYAQIINVIIGFLLPILLNLIILYLNMRHIRLTSRLGSAQHHVTAREKYNRSLVIQFLVFYAIWLILWSPNIVVYQFTSKTSSITVIASLLNYIEIALDPVIIGALDVRFQHIWRSSRRRILNALCSEGANARRVAPATTDMFRSSAYGRSAASIQAKQARILTTHSNALPAPII
ncbi:unnamed protein product [Adineta ricciae]|uniref:G-protein coupled receptors family 1 profile domain-containing protein n=1 Tax=Adineta ricciae TaxID=249248 RepID=A0A813PY88_ADIRI|nr:unnamed protein product [Adineta ricciae]CAF1203112.1 unnamed protein product [Adineta ricciae]